MKTALMNISPEHSLKKTAYLKNTISDIRQKMHSYLYENNTYWKYKISPIFHCREKMIYFLCIMHKITSCKLML